MKEILYDPNVVREVLKRERERKCQKAGLTMVMIQNLRKKMTTSEKRK